MSQQAKSVSQPQVYLAGFDVFRQDGLARGEYMKGVCAEHGLKGAYPFDNKVDPTLAKGEAAASICQMNIEMIRQSQALLVNLNNFRGHEPDSGTVFEFGMGIALSKPVWVYFDDGGASTMMEMIPHNEAGHDKDGYVVEDFGLPRNLMLACTWAGASKTFEEAVRDLAKHLSENH